jgi:hypothetical protein
MAFSRALAPSVEPSSDHLTAAMVGTGFGLAAAPAEVEPNIEDTLLFASVLAMERDDLRVLAMLMTWWGTHHECVNADPLTKLAAAHPAARVQALWSALATWKSKDRRFARLQKVYTGPRIDASPSRSAFQIRRHGEDARLEGRPVRAAASSGAKEGDGVEAIRPRPVVTRQETVHRRWAPGVVVARRARWLVGGVCPGGDTGHV